MTLIIALSLLLVSINAFGRDYHVMLSGDDNGDGTVNQPFQTINRAASVSIAGDVVWVHPGVYRELVIPKNGGTKKKPIVYRATKRGGVFIKGSDLIPSSQWQVWSENSKVITFSLKNYPFELEHPSSSTTKNSFDIPLAAAHTRILDEKSSEESACLGQVFVQGKPYVEKGLPWKKDIYRYYTKKRSHGNKQMIDPECNPVNKEGVPLNFGTVEGTWAYDNSSKMVYVRLSEEDFLFYKRNKELLQIELSVRHSVFSPLPDGDTPHIHVFDFVMEHAANQFPLEFWSNWRNKQVGLISTNHSSHWVIEGNIIRYAKTIGIQAGGNGESHKGFEGGHIIRNNEISYNGSCGIVGFPCIKTLVLNNFIHHNNYLRFKANENGGVKFHGFNDGEIIGNVVWRNKGYGVWIDNGWRDAKVKSNIFVDNLKANLFVEIGFGPALVSDNILWGASKDYLGNTVLSEKNLPQGDGIKIAEARNVTVKNNVIGDSDGYGISGRAIPKRGKKNNKTGEFVILGLQNNTIVNNTFVGGDTIKFPTSDFVTNNMVKANKSISDCKMQFTTDGFSLSGAMVVNEKLPIAEWLKSRLESELKKEK